MSDKLYLLLPKVYCPECHYEYDVNITEDRLRVKIRHPEKSTPSSFSKTMQKLYPSRQLDHTPIKCSRAGEVEVKAIANFIVKLT